jgi:hypothetical protein
MRGVIHGQLIRLMDDVLMKMMGVKLDCFDVLMNFTRQ